MVSSCICASLVDAPSQMRQRNVWFVVTNSLWILGHRDEWDTPKGMFCIRALLAHDLKINGDKFHGSGDTPFDEAVYNANRLMRAPCAVKATGVVPMFPGNADLAVFGGNGVSINNPFHPPRITLIDKSEQIRIPPPLVRTVRRRCQFGSGGAHLPISAKGK